MITDNYGTHKHERVKKWLKRHPRFHMNFTPTSLSWLNMVERFLRESPPRPFSVAPFQGVAALVHAIETYMT